MLNIVLRFRECFYKGHDFIVLFLANAKFFVKSIHDRLLFTVVVLDILAYFFEY